VWDCSKIGDFYECGCAEDGDGKKKEISRERMEKISGANGRDFDMDLLKEGIV
jgi:FAD-linked sulfhydryl oxidase